METGYEWVWADKEKRLRAITLMHQARERAHDRLAPPRYKSLPQAMSTPDTKEASSSTSALLAATVPASSANGVPVVRDTHPKQAASHTPMISGPSAQSASSTQASTRTTKGEEDHENAESGHSRQKWLRRAHRKVTRAMAKLQKAQQEMAALMKSALPATKFLLLILGSKSESRYG